MGEKRNHSDVPAGDIDPNRQAFRGGMTTYNWDMKAVSFIILYHHFLRLNSYCEVFDFE